MILFRPKTIIPIPAYTEQFLFKIILARMIVESSVCILYTQLKHMLNTIGVYII